MNEPNATAPAGPSGETNGELRRQMARVIQEYLRLDKQLQVVENTNFRVCIFGSARIRRRDPTWQMVYMLAKRLAQMGVDIVTGGGPGLMEAANRAVQDAHNERAKTYGLPLDIPSLREPANKHLDIKSAHQRFSTRLDEFMRLSHAVIVAPGGIGTLLELSYVWQLVQIGLMEPRPVLLLGDMWPGLLDWMRDAMAGRGFINPSDLDDVHLVSTRDEVIDILKVEQEKFLQQLGTAKAGLSAPPVSVTVGQPLDG
ncbi:MAG TPA: LOG family protein [Armatimonadota bacterium]|jgi:hypothetical protein